MSRSPLSAGLPIVAVLAAAGAAAAQTPVLAPTPGLTDRFGVYRLYRTAASGKEWTAKWDDGADRTVTSGLSDAKDPWLSFRGEGMFHIDGQGQLVLSGPSPEMFVRDPSLDVKNSWRNVEMTVYAKRLSGYAAAWGGIEGVARTNHGVTGGGADFCDTRGIHARMRSDGHIDFEKETGHPNYAAIADKPLWSALPYDAWIGYKLVVYDLPNGNVKLELWYDDTDGAGGGDWVKINELEDNGANFGVGGVPCKAGLDPAMRLANADDRQGTESGKPNMAVYWRSDAVNANGLIYKKMSVREIDPDRLAHTAAPTAVDRPNLALGKPTAASSIESPATPPSAATDGSKATRWASQHADPQWLSVDLGRPETIEGFTLQWEAAYASAYQIFVSTNGVQWQQVYSTTAGKGGQESLSIAPTEARYVRLSGTQRATAFGYSLWEFQVNGATGTPTPLSQAPAAAVPDPTPSLAATPAAGADPKAPQRFLTPNGDGINDEAVFGATAAEVTVYDLRGREVFHASSGSPLKWGGADSSGRRLPSGVYLAKIKTTDSKTVYQSIAVAR
jgi:hypothetical protein